MEVRCRTTNADVTKRTPRLAQLAAFCCLGWNLPALPGTPLEALMICGQGRSWRIPAPDVHPASAAVAPALLSPSVSPRLDRTLAHVLPFHEIRVKMRKRFYIFIAIGAFLAYSGLIEPNWLEVRTYDLKIDGLPHNVTIVHVADIHTKQPGYREAKATAIINQIEPDYVFVTGDLLKSSSQIADGLDFMSGLQAKCGVYAVSGNADGKLVASIDRGITPKAYANWRFLENESVDCGDFTLVGIDDPVTCRDDLAKAMVGVDLARPVIAITHFHAKKLLAKLVEMHVALVLSGHTHGGQIGFGPLVNRIEYAHRSKFIAGLYKLDGTYLEVTRGVGTNIFPLRFLCRPEIVVFHLHG